MAGQEKPARARDRHQAGNAAYINGLCKDGHTVRYRARRHPMRSLLPIKARARPVMRRHQPHPIHCTWCGTPTDAWRTDRQSCGGRCQKQAWRAKQRQTQHTHRHDQPR